MRNTGPNQKTRTIVMERDREQCVRCCRFVGGGTPGVTYSIHHRIARQMGGSRDPRLNKPSNLLLLCGSGTTGCHGKIESNRADARRDGYLVWRSQDPTEVPVKVATRFDPVEPKFWFFLDDEGNMTRTEAPE